MPQKRHYARAHKRALEQALRDELKAIGDSVVITAGNIAEKVIRQTLRYSTQFGAGGPSYEGGGKHATHPGLRDADVQVEYETKVNRRGLSLTLYITVIDPSGKPHFVWHLLSEGRKKFTQKRTSPPIRERRGLRTSPNSLEVTSFPGYTGDVFVIHAGQRVEGIEARHWYEATAKEVQRQLDGLFKGNLAVYGIRFVSYKVRQLS